MAAMTSESVTDPSALRHVVRIRALDTIFRVETDDIEVAERLRVQWSRCLVEHATHDETRLPIDSGRGTLDSLTYTLASTITRRAIEAEIGHCVMFHACGLVDDAGRTAALVAASGTGKTTAAATLARDQFAYLTDEAVVIRKGGAVLPYPKPLSVVKPTGGKAQFSPDELGLRSLAPKPRLRALVLLERLRDAVEPRLEVVPLLDAILALLPQTSGLPSLDRPLQQLCETIDRCGGVYRLTYSEIGRAGNLLRDLLASELGAVEEWSSTSSNSTLKTEVPAESLVGGFRRSAVLDGVQVGNEALLLLGSLPVRLRGIGLTIWRESHPSADLTQLVEAAIREHGPHPAADANVDRAIKQMLDSGVLERVDSRYGRDAPRDHPAER